MSQPVCWIGTPHDTDLDKAGRAAMERVRRPDRTIPNLYRAFAAWPAADGFYRAILHAPGGPLAMAEREMIGLDPAALAALAGAEQPGD